MTAEYTVQGDIATITLNNPPVNGLGHSTRLGITDALAKANADGAEVGQIQRVTVLPQHQHGSAGDG